MKKDTTKTVALRLVANIPGVKTDTAHIEMTLKRYKYKLVLHKAGNREEYYNDGKTTAIYNQKTDEVAYDTAPDLATQKRNRTSPGNLFTIHENGFYYHFIKEDTLDGTVMEYIDLFPEMPKKVNYHTIHLIIDKANNRITSITILNKDGSEIKYIVDSYIPNRAIPEHIFKFRLKSNFCPR